MKIRFKKNKLVNGKTQKWKIQKLKTKYTTSKNTLTKICDEITGWNDKIKLNIYEAGNNKINYFGIY